jgi:UPF0176 protein
MPPADDRILNVSTYRFVPLDDLDALRERLHADATARGLLGTVLLAPEGINLFLAGAPDALRGWLATLREDPRFAGLDAKESWSDTTPFRRLKVKVKREIIRMDRPAIRPIDGRAPSVAPATLARWLAQGRDDEGREVVMLDTRNAFEVDAGTFEGTLDWRLRKFGDFPAALDTHLGELQGRTVVSFCTGGIRCEKAALLMRERGLAHVHQLEGGILRYFEETGGHAPGWRGGCFVFDERVALGADLAPTPAPLEPHSTDA